MGLRWLCWWVGGGGGGDVDVDVNVIRRMV